MPRGLEVVGHPTTTCLNGVVTLFHSQLTLQRGTIPAGSSCTISVDVASQCDGEFTNRIPAGALQTSTGSNAAAAFASVEFCCEGQATARDMCFLADTIDDEDMSVFIE